MDRNFGWIEATKNRSSTTAVFYSLTNALNAVTALGVSLLNAYVLGAQGRGETANTLQWAYVVWPLMTLGLDKYLSRHASLSRTELATLMRIPVMSAISFTVLLSISNVSIFYMAIPVIALGNAYLALLRVWSMKNQRTRSFVLTTLTFALTNIGISLTLFLTNDLNPENWLIPYAIPGIICVVETVFRSRAPFSLSQKQIVNSSKLVIGGVSIALILRLDRLILGATYPAEDLGRYVVVATVFEAMLWPIIAKAQILATQTESNAVARIVTLKSVSIWLIACTLTAGLTFVSLPYLGSSYVQARELILPLALSSAPLALTQFQWANLLKSEDWKVSGNPAIVGVPFALLIYPIMIYHFGAIGAAWGSVLCYSAVSSAGWIYWKRSKSKQVAGMKL